MPKVHTVRRRAVLQGPLALLAAATIGGTQTASAQAATGEVWWRASNGMAVPVNLLHASFIADQSGILDIDVLYPGLIPQEAVSLILTVEGGWLAFPSGGTGCVSLRVMSDGYNLTNVLDRAKHQEWVVSYRGVDVVACDVRMPLAPGHRTFFWALQSTHPSEAKKLALIDVWGYVL